MSVVPLFTAQNQFYCYIIASGNRTYNGYTNNLTRRLRQHNREIKGGARATGIQANDANGVAVSWQYIAILTCMLWTAQRAMQVEWNIKYPTRHKPRERCFQGPHGRICSFNEVFKFVKDDGLVLYVHADYIHLVENKYENICVLEIGTLVNSA